MTLQEQLERARASVNRFLPEKPLPCPECEEVGSEFFDHPLLGWRCAKCFDRMQEACIGLVAVCENRAIRRLEQQRKGGGE